MADLFDFEAGSWNMDLIASLFTPSSVSLTCQLLSLSPDCQDEIAWMQDNSGRFLVKHAYISFIRWRSSSSHPFSERD